MFFLYHSVFFDINPCRFQCVIWIVSWRNQGEANWQLLDFFHGLHPLFEKNILEKLKISTSSLSHKLILSQPTSRLLWVSSNVLAETADSSGRRLVVRGKPIFHISAGHHHPYPTCTSLGIGSSVTGSDGSPSHPVLASSLHSGSQLGLRPVPASVTSTILSLRVRLKYLLKKEIIGSLSTQYWLHHKSMLEHECLLGYLVKFYIKYILRFSRVKKNLPPDLNFINKRPECIIKFLENHHALL